MRGANPQGGPPSVQRRDQDKACRAPRARKIVADRSRALATAACFVVAIFPSDVERRRAASSLPAIWPVHRCPARRWDKVEQPTRNFRASWLSCLLQALARFDERKDDGTISAITYTIPDAQRISGIGRTKLFELIKGGKLRVNRVTGRTLIVGDSLRALLNGEGV